MPAVPLKHGLTELALVEVPDRHRGLGVTVMDGPCFSLMPFPARGLHTLSHVRYTPHAHWYDGGGDYTKQFGLPVYVLAALAPRDVPGRGRFLLASRYVAALAGAAVVAALVTIFARRCGLVTGLALLAFVAADPGYGSFLHSLYWLPWLSLLPLVVVSWSGTRRTRRRPGSA